MEYFTDDEVERGNIAKTLQNCGCCPRCVLRHMGLKEPYIFRKSLQEIEAIVDKLTAKADTDMGKVVTGSSVASGNSIENCVASAVLNNASEQGNLAAVAMETEQKVNDGDSKKDQPETVTTENGETENDSQPNNTQIDGQQTMEVEQKTKTCVVCLGILQEFGSDEFLQEIKTKVMKEDYHFSTYLCSLTVPVCIILREHSMFLHLKEKHSSVYEAVKPADVPPVKEIWKWRNGPILGRLLGAPFSQQSPFDVTLNFLFANSDRECTFLMASSTDTFRRRKQERKKKNKVELYTRANVAKAVTEMTDEEFLRNYSCPPQVPVNPCICDISLNHEAVFIAGRYNKYSRLLSQTPWILDGVRKSESSVEEYICDPIDSKFKPSSHKFSSSGREDVDVKMLGKGRPFVVELVNPHHVEFSQAEMTDLQKSINGSTTDVQVRDLQIVSRSETDNLKEGEIDKLKTYSALCWSAKPLSQEQLDTLAQTKDLTLLQKTPIRVLHRRPLATREKHIHSMEVAKIDEFHFKLSLSTQAGTYIKEFIHGDFGRTRPSLCSLLDVDCDILELDVESVDLDWPKAVDDTSLDTDKQVPS